MANYKLNFTVLLFLKLLAVVFSEDKDETFNYDRQVIVLLEGDYAPTKAAKYLYRAHKGKTDIVRWDRFNERFFGLKIDGNDVLADDRKSLVNVEDWAKTRVYVITHGSTKDQNFGSVTAEKLHDIIFGKLVPLGPPAENIKRISLVGCTESSIGDKEAPPFFNEFKEELLESGNRKTEISIRSGLVTVDFQGRKLVGRRIPGGNIEWKHSKQGRTKWVYKPDENKVVNEDKEATFRNPSITGLLSLNEPVYVLKSTKVKDDYIKKRCEIDNDNALDWVKEKSDELFKSDTEAPKIFKRNKDVHMLFNREPKIKETDQIKEIHNMKAFLHELVHYGKEGPLTTGESQYTYYRFGDWIVRMNLKTFYMHTVGIIDDGSPEVKEFIDWADKNHKKNLVEEHGPMRDAIDKKSYFSDAEKWITGKPMHDENEIRSKKVNLAKAYNAQSIAAVFLSEAIRCFHTHITNMMSLQLARNGYLEVDQFLETHPMARGNTWQLTESGTYQGKKVTGLQMLLRKPLIDDIKRMIKSIEERIERVTKTWFSRLKYNIDADNTIQRSSKDRYKVYTNERVNGNERAEFLSQITFDGNFELERLNHFTSGSLLTAKITEPEQGATETQVKEFVSTDEASLPLQASIALANDNVHVTELIQEEINHKEEETGKKYEIIPDSIEQTDDTASFTIQEKRVFPYPERVSINIDRKKLSSHKLIEKIKAKVDNIKESWHELSGKAALVNKGISMYGIAMGLAGSVGSFVEGDVVNGSIGLAQSLHGTGELTGVNKAIYKTAGKYMNKALSASVEGVSETIASVGSGELAQLAKASGEEVVSLIGKLGEFAEDLPIVGTAFGIYMIIEDFNKSTTIGYIDGALDIAITGLSLLGPEMEPFVLALTIIRMGIDTFYKHIDENLKALPKDASFLEVYNAYVLAYGESIIDLSEQYSITESWLPAGRMNKVIQQQQKDKPFLDKIMDYHNYYQVMVNKSTDATDINFAAGIASWNGGAIRFWLGESNTSILRLVDSTTGIAKNYTIKTEGVNEIVMGIGQTHAVSFRTEEFKLFGFITYDKRTIISGVNAEELSLFGSYHGNSKGNIFYAVQDLPSGSDLKYSLSDYHYMIYGKGGSDIFYLGPQYTFASGDEGSDTYIISNKITRIKINNYADDRETDFMTINATLNHLTLSKDGTSLLITNTVTKAVIEMMYWFRNIDYDYFQHLVFTTSDGYSFKVPGPGNSLNKIFVALNFESSTSGLFLDTRTSDYSQVRTIKGGNGHDIMLGNDLGNHINGGLGDDTIQGNNGLDAYIMEYGHGTDVLNNFAEDGKEDMLYLPYMYGDIKYEAQRRDLVIYHLSDETSPHDHLNTIIIRNWFVGPENRHLLFVSKDGILFNASETRSDFQFKPIMADSGLKPESSRNIINLRDAPEFANITTLIGADGDEFLFGNSKNNYISGGKGNDIFIGSRGADTYVVHGGQGEKTIYNSDDFLTVDTLMFDEEFDKITLSNDTIDLILTSSSSKNIKVILKYWFGGTYAQHLVVHSNDGVIFQLPSEYSVSLQKIAKVMNKLEKVDNKFYNLYSSSLQKVERFVGGNGSYQVTGNSLNNYIETSGYGVESITLSGYGGSDTYVIHKGSQGVNIFNFDYEETPDTLIYPALYEHIFCRADEDNKQNLHVYDFDPDGSIVNIYYYNMSSQYRHLTIISEDGIHFVVTTEEFKKAPVLINKASETKQVNIDLTAQSDYSEVITVRGSNYNANTITGNNKNNTLIGGSEPDTLKGGEGHDVLKGGASNDHLDGGLGNDMILGGVGDDELYGGDGDDVIYPGPGSNTVYGGNGSDTVMYGGSVTTRRGILVDLQYNICWHTEDDSLSVTDTLNNIENIYGTEYADGIYGDDEDNVLDGRGGSDYLIPGTGYDLLIGGEGTDVYDVTDANGTVTIDNYDTVGIQDLLRMRYTVPEYINTQRAGDDLVIRVADQENTMLLDTTKPVVIVKKWYVGSDHQHLALETSNGIYYGFATAVADTN